MNLNPKQLIFYITTNINSCFVIKAFGSNILSPFDGVKGTKGLKGKLRR